VNLRLAFCWIGLVVFALPMLPNIAYAIWPPRGGEAPPARKYPLLEGVEQASRTFYLLALTLLVSSTPRDMSSPWLYLGIVFLALYFVVWLRYFVGGRDPLLLGTSFLGIPVPLAVFPVLYFLCAALWLHNPVAAGCMLVFGIAHITVSCRTLPQV